MMNLYPKMHNIIIEGVYSFQAYTVFIHFVILPCICQRFKILLFNFSCFKVLITPYPLDNACLVGK